jgi:hypothetical protein
MAQAEQVDHLGEFLHERMGWLDKVIARNYGQQLMQEVSQLTYDDNPFFLGFEDDNTEGVYGIPLTGDPWPAQKYSQYKYVALTERGLVAVERQEKGPDFMVRITPITEDNLLEVAPSLTQSGSVLRKRIRQSLINAKIILVEIEDTPPGSMDPDNPYYLWAFAKDVPFAFRDPENILLQEPFNDFSGE